MTWAREIWAIECLRLLGRGPWIEFELGSFFVSIGMGTSILPVRVNAPPEFVIARLIPQQSGTNYEGGRSSKIRKLESILLIKEIPQKIQKMAHR
jgi:hypothetical protein